MTRLDFVAEELARLRGEERLRELRMTEPTGAARADVNGRNCADFSSNDYLGLSCSEELIEAACDAARKSGSGAGASRLISGNRGVHEALEAELAAWLGTEAALVFNSGYQANLGVLTALARRGDRVVSDELNHASLIDGCRLSRAEVSIFRHGDSDHAAELLGAGRSEGKRAFIVTDALFSMDGDRADLGALSDVAERFGAVLIADEAHAVGVVGGGGRGVARAAGAEVDVHIGTFGKAFGSFGAYVAGSRELRELLINRARSFVFTTALPPAVVGASREALRVVAGDRGEVLRSRLRSHIRRMAEALKGLGLLVPGAGASPIFPIVVGEEGATMSCCERLLERGIFVQGIRPPTVPRGTSRLRLALSAAHAEEDLEAAVSTLAELREEGVLPGADEVLSRGSEPGRRHGGE